MLCALAGWVNDVVRDIPRTQQGGEVAGVGDSAVGDHETGRLGMVLGNTLPERAELPGGDFNAVSARNASGYLYRQFQHVRVRPSLSQYHRCPTRRLSNPIG